MRPIRLFFYLLLLFYHLALVIIAMNLTDAMATNLSNNAELVRTLALVGLVLFLVVFAFSLYDRRHHRRRIDKLEAEKNAVKAQVFDMKRREDELDREIKSFESSLSRKETSSRKDTDPDQTTTS